MLHTNHGVAVSLVVFIVILVSSQVLTASLISDSLIHHYLNISWSTKLYRGDADQTFALLSGGSGFQKYSRSFRTGNLSESGLQFPENRSPPIPSLPVWHCQASSCAVHLLLLIKGSQNTDQHSPLLPVPVFHPAISDCTKALNIAVYEQAREALLMTPGLLEVFENGTTGIWPTDFVDHIRESSSFIPFPGSDAWLDGLGDAMLENQVDACLFTPEGVWLFQSEARMDHPYGKPGFKNLPTPAPTKPVVNTSPFERSGASVRFLTKHKWITLSSYELTRLNLVDKSQNCNSVTRVHPTSTRKTKEMTTLGEGRIRPPIASKTPLPANKIKKPEGLSRELAEDAGFIPTSRVDWKHSSHKTISFPLHRANTSTTDPASSSPPDTSTVTEKKGSVTVSANPQATGLPRAADAFSGSGFELSEEESLPDTGATMMELTNSLRKVLYDVLIRKLKESRSNYKQLAKELFDLHDQLSKVDQRHMRRIFNTIITEFPMLRMGKDKYQLQEQDFLDINTLKKKLSSWDKEKIKNFLTLVTIDSFVGTFLLFKGVFRETLLHCSVTRILPGSVSLDQVIETMSAIDSRDSSMFSTVPPYPYYSRSIYGECLQACFLKTKKKDTWSLSGLDTLGHAGYGYSELESPFVRSSSIKSLHDLTSLNKPRLSRKVIGLPSEIPPGINTVINSYQLLACNLNPEMAANLANLLSGTYNYSPSHYRILSPETRLPTIMGLMRQYISRSMTHYSPEHSLWQMIGILRVEFKSSHFDEKGFLILR